MNVRTTFPQEWRFETNAEYYASEFRRVCVVGDFAYVEKERQFYPCTLRDKCVTPSFSDNTPTFFYFDMRGPMNSRRTCLTRPGKFNGHYYQTLSKHWPGHSFGVFVDAHDVGLTEFLGHGEFPWRQWHFFRFKFKNGALIQAVVEFTGFSVACSSPANSFACVDMNPASILEQCLTNYNIWRSFKHISQVRVADKCLAWYAQILELTLTLAPLNLPAYPLLWLFEWLHEDTLVLSEKVRIDLIQGVYNSRRRVGTEREKHTKK